MILSEQLLAAYRATDFHVYTDTPFVLNIGQFSKDLELFHTKHDVRSSAIITAHNPFSQQRSSDFNEQAQKQLYESIKQLGYEWVDAEGKDPAAEWPSEQSVLVLGCELFEIKHLGETYKQNAIVWTDGYAVPELVILVK